MTNVDGVEVHDFGSGCPKCTTPMRIAVWCPGCDDVLESDHLHAICAGCGFRRIERCADWKRPAPPALPPAGGSFEP